MKIAIVAPTHLPARRANTLQVMKMAQALTCLGHDVRVASPGNPGTTIAWEEIADLYGLQTRFPVEWLPAAPSLRRYDYGLRAVSWARRNGAEVLYTRLPQAAAIASSLGMPTILEVHDLPSSGMNAWLFRRFLRGSGGRRLVAITHALASDLAKELGAPPPPFTVIAPDGVDLGRYEGLPLPAQAREQLGVPPERFTAGYTGHLYAGRGIKLILEMATRLPKIGFLLAGGEPEDVERLRLTLKDRHLENVTLAGFVSNATLPRYHAACDAFLMPYQRHVAASSGGDIARYLSPLKLFEYMACGRPILSSDLPVFGEVLSPQNAILLPPEDAQAWVEALQSLSTDPVCCARLGEQARQDAGRYTWEKRAESILEGIDRA